MTIGENVVVGAGCRIRETIVLDGRYISFHLPVLIFTIVLLSPAGARIGDHSCLLFAIIGWNSVIGGWVRIEGTPNDPNPNKPFAKLDVKGVFLASFILAYFISYRSHRPFRG